MRARPATRERALIGKAVGPQLSQKEPRDMLAAAQRVQDDQTRQ